MMYYSVFSLATAIVVFWRIQIAAARSLNHEEHPVFWVTLFLVDFVLAPVLFVIMVSNHNMFVLSVRKAFLERRQNKS
tara:strand:+ start:478 stop:711 length:234 start_codon:yes stop_codon:yes gene_type:complete